MCIGVGISDFRGVEIGLIRLESSCFLGIRGVKLIVNVL